MSVAALAARGSLLAAGLLLGLAPPAAAARPDGEIRRAGGAGAIAGSYLVVFKDRAVRQSAVTGAATGLAGRAGGKVARVFRHAVRGFELSGPAAAARRAAADPAVAFVEQNHRMRVSDTQSPAPSWGLDRVDQHLLPLDGEYRYPSRAGGVRAYIVDTGIRLSHQDFGGRAVSGFDAIDGGTADDCHGHGTHVAGTVGGETYGLAKGVTLVAVRVLDCSGEGTTAQVVAGVDWVTGDHDPGEPAVANMSLGGEADDVIDAAVAASVADGVSYVAAAGNDDTDACQHSPARTPAAITVGATGGYFGEDDDRAWFSNYGTCLDIFAPGVDIVSDFNTTDSDTDTLSGTSMAAPHVTGAAALLLALHPGYTPQQVHDALLADSTAGVVGDPGTGSPDALLYVADDPPDNDFSLAASPAAATVDPGGTATVAVRTGTTAGAPQQVNLTVAGLPAGVTATVSPASVVSGGTATLSITAAAQAAMGEFPLTVTGTGPATGVSHRMSYPLTVRGPAGCVVTNPTGLAIPDLTTVRSVMPVHGCAGAASPRSAVEVHISHSYPPDLTVDLVAPDGTAYPLYDGAATDGDSLDLSATLDLSGHAADGVWLLRIADTFAFDEGTLLSWRLDLAGPPVTPGCAGDNPGDAPVFDLTTVTSAVPIAGCGRAASASSTVAVHIVHSFVGDLVIDLIAPDGTAYRLHDSSSDSTSGLDRTYTRDLSAETADGVWRLRISDVGYSDTGYLNSWSLRL
jgi:subtilisin-like proprotein convertase family protein